MTWMLAGFALLMVATPMLARSAYVLATSRIRVHQEEADILASVGRRGEAATAGASSN